jgi:[acyl-carrier-protein] S-malonyltransferase
MTIALVFPGQGSQAVGMGRALAEAFAPAREVFEEVDDALSAPLSRLMFDGPPETLGLTENAQPALMAVGVAVVRVLQQAGLDLRRVHAVAGHSLGEYAALAAAGALDLADTARLLRRRGQAMQEAVPVGEGAMAALLGLEVAEAEAVAAEAAADQVCVVANDNAPGQQVVSGHAAAVDRAVALAAARGARRSVRLQVSAPFHCPLMRPAARAVAAALAPVELRAPVVPLVANVTAAPVTAPDTIRALLVEQVTARVRWRESVERMRADGVSTLIECGAGRVLSGLGRRIDSTLVCHSVGTPQEVEAAAERLAADDEM